VLDYFAHEVKDGSPRSARDDGEGVDGGKARGDADGGGTPQKTVIASEARQSVIAIEPVEDGHEQPVIASEARQSVIAIEPVEDGHQQPVIASEARQSMVEWSEVAGGSPRFARDDEEGRDDVLGRSEVLGRNDEAERDGLVRPEEGALRNDANQEAKP
jgi:hypothetical protein